MRRLCALLLAVTAQPATVFGQILPSSPDAAPSVTDVSVPLTYVGADGSISIGINDKGRTEGQLTGVFARNNARAFIGQLWWDRNGAGGAQGDYNWLWGMDPLRAREHPDQVTVARLSFALDQNAEHDRKATLGFGIERREFALEAWLARGISSARVADSTVQTDLLTVDGVDDLGSFTQVQATRIETLFERRPYERQFGLQASHVFEPMALRVHAGASLENGDGAHGNTFSVGVDSPLGTHGWTASATAEHVSARGPYATDGSDNRVSAYLRYEFGGRGAFVPTSSLVDPAWIARSLARPSNAHPRVVESYRRKRTQTVTVTRDPKQYGNRFPVLGDDSASTSVDQPVTIDVLANDSDPDGDALVLTAVTPPAHGSASLAGTRLVYTPANGYAGVDTFRYTVADGRGGAASATVVVTISGVPNHAPLARDDAASTPFGQAVNIDVLANDSDPDNDALTLVSLTQPSAGSAVINGNSVTYTPSPLFSGSDRFTYTISDGRGSSASATVTISVAPLPNRPPIARNDSVKLAFGQTGTIDVLANDSDPDGDPLRIASVTTPANGSAVIGAGAVKYTPAPGFSGTDTFTYTISDGRGGRDSATVTVSVAPTPNQPPVAVDDAASTTSGLPVSIAVLANDSDPDGDVLSISAVTAPSGGSAVISGNAISYTPAAGFVGTDRFNYTISDGRGGSASAIVTVTISALPNRPPVAVADAATTTSGQPVSIAVLANDSDPDGDTLSISAITAPASGSAVISGNAISYTPAAGFVGTDRFSYTISDGRGGSANALVTVTIAPLVNRPPVAINDVASSTGGPVAIPVLANDSDPDGDVLSIVSVTTPAGGSAAISGTTIVYTPGPGAFASGIDTFSYTISDGRGGSASAVVTVTMVPPANNPPIAVADTGAINQTVIAVLANDSDPDGDPLTIIAVTQPVDGTGAPAGTVAITGSTVTWSPPAGFLNSATFTYTISDGRGGTASAIVNVVTAIP